MTRKEKYAYILQYFRKQMPEVQTELEFGSVFQLLVAVILSAQCTDKRVNMVTPALFERFQVDSASEFVVKSNTAYFNQYQLTTIQAIKKNQNNI